MTTDELKQRLGNHKWSLLMALLMLLMIALGYKIARKLDAGDSQKVLAQADTIALLLEENNQLTTKVNQLEIALALEGDRQVVAEPIRQTAATVSVRRTISR